MRMTLESMVAKHRICYFASACAKTPARLDDLSQAEMQFPAMSPPRLSDLELSGTNRVVQFVAVMRSFNSSLDELCARFSFMHMHAPYVFRIF
jgi:hypothetical protein